MSPVLKFGLLATLAAIAVLYFGVIVWRTSTLTLVLLRSGYADRGWDERRLAARVSALGWIGLALSVVALSAAIIRVLG